MLKGIEPMLTPSSFLTPEGKGTPQYTALNFAALTKLCREAPEMIAGRFRYFPRCDHEFVSYLGRCMQEDARVVFWKDDILLASQEGNESFIGQQFTFNDFPNALTFWDLETDRPMHIDHTRNPDGTPLWDDGLWNLASMIGIRVPPCNANATVLMEAVQLAPPEYQENVIRGNSEPTMLFFGMLSRMPEHVNSINDLMPMFIPAGIVFDGDPIIGELSAIVAAARWLQLPFVTTEEATVNRAERRRAERNNVVIKPVDVVTLRRRDTHREVGHHATDREYQCQWIRRGHWRRLHQPRKADGVEVVYVNSALCGPAGKPLKAPSMTVAAAIR